MINPVVVGRDQLLALEALRNLAAEHPVWMPDLMARLASPASKRRHMRQMAAQTIFIPLDYTVTFSIETGHPVGPCRHMSMASGRLGMVPIPEAVWMIAENLGFVGSLKECEVWTEDIWNATQKAVNIVQPIAVAETSRA